jgi:2-hydroxychromene-2-carboxylate isomerase
VRAKTFFKRQFDLAAPFEVLMGELVQLDERRRARAGADQAPVVRCFVDLACPFSYLTAERVERSVGRVSWRLASTASLERRAPLDGEELARARLAAVARARQLRLPLVWPDAYPSAAPKAMRIAHRAVELGRGGAFVLAASRMAFGGGFDLEDPETLAEAAAAAGLDLDDSFAAARDERRDGAIDAAGRRLLAIGADRLPALRSGRSLFWGEQQISGFLMAPRAARRQSRP